jgi:hypothetical protein
MVKYRILATDLGDSGDQGPARLALEGVVWEDSGDNIILVVLNLARGGRDRRRIN